MCTWVNKGPSWYYISAVSWLFTIFSAIFGHLNAFSFFKKQQYMNLFISIAEWNLLLLDEEWTEKVRVLCRILLWHELNSYELLSRRYGLILRLRLCVLTRYNRGGGGVMWTRLTDWIIWLFSLLNAPYSSARITCGKKFKNRPANDSALYNQERPLV